MSFYGKGLGTELLPGNHFLHEPYLALLRQDQFGLRLGQTHPVKCTSSDVTTVQ